MVNFVAELAAIMFTILKTIKLWGLSPHSWLLAYLQECAMRGGVPPDRVDPFLPWNMKDSLRRNPSLKTGSPNICFFREKDEAKQPLVELNSTTQCIIF